MLWPKSLEENDHALPGDASAKDEPQFDGQTKPTPSCAELDDMVRDLLGDLSHFSFPGHDAMDIFAAS
jgi:hypothetical protein